MGLGLLPAPGSNVNVQILQLGDFLFLFGGGQVVGLEADHPGKPLFPHQHPLADEHPAVDAPHGVEF